MVVKEGEPVISVGLLNQPKQQKVLTSKFRTILENITYRHVRLQPTRTSWDPAALTM